MSSAHHPRPVVLIICDGWGPGVQEPDGARREGNAVVRARTPVRRRLLDTRPWNYLATSGEAVGLPAGQMGNSEVGHLNLGAGRIVYQDVTRIGRSIQDGSFRRLAPLAELAEDLRASGGAVHLMGLCSDGGVHSHIEHLEALIRWADDAHVPARIHCFTDGRDTSPRSGLGFVGRIADRAASVSDARVATVSGRYFAMDRDQRWDRTGKAYRAVVEGSAPTSESPRAAVAASYDLDVTDEFIRPVVIQGPDQPPYEGIGSNDGVVFLNFRADRARQLTAALTDPGFDVFDRPRGTIQRVVTMTRYVDDSPLTVLFSPRDLRDVLGQVVAAAGGTQVRVAETEKYPHVTYFFNGGVEEPSPGEERLLVPSPRVATYDLEPDMSAAEVTGALLQRLEPGGPDFVLINYANADMVGHTGSIPAAVEAVETVDRLVGRVLDRVLELGGAALVTADHGNAERMLERDGRPFTAHTIYQVECIYVGPDRDPVAVRPGILADVAPTLLELLGFPVPAAMTGRSLLIR